MNDNRDCTECKEETVNLFQSTREKLCRMCRHRERRESEEAGQSVEDDQG